MNKRLNIKYVDKLSGRQFEFYCGWLFRRFLNDFNPKDVRVTQATNDHGADVLVNDRKDGNLLLAFQCKHLSNPNQRAIKYEALEETIAGKAYYHANGALLITNGFVSKRIRKDAKHMGIEVLNRYALENMINHVIEKTRIPGYSTVRMSRKNAITFKNIQGAVGFKSRNALITDMLKRCKPIYLNTPEKRNTYHKLMRLSITSLELQGEMK